MMTLPSNKTRLKLERERQRVQQLLRIAASTTNYYDSLTSDQVEEDRDWGLVAAAQFTSEGS
jgi:hypothetical protein